MKGREEEINVGPAQHKEKERAREERDWAEREKGEGKMDQPKGRKERKKKG